MSEPIKAVPPPKTAKPVVVRPVQVAAAQTKDQAATVEPIVKVAPVKVEGEGPAVKPVVKVATVKTAGEGVAVKPIVKTAAAKPSAHPAPSKTTPAAEQEMPTLNPIEIILMLLAFAGGAFAAAVLLPTWLPGLTESLLGAEPKAFWYLARSAGVISYVLLWVTMVFGMVVSNKMARLWNGGPTAVELHQFVTWLAVAFGFFHALILLGDRFIQASVIQVLVPFAYTGFEPFWTGLGQIGLYLTIIVAASFYFRKQMGQRAWRMLHYVSFVVYTMLTLHGILAGSDSSSPIMLAVYGVSAASVYFLLLVRVFDAVKVTREGLHSGVKSA